MKDSGGYTVADFFCGAGGFSEGFKRAGFRVVMGMDNWQNAVETHKLNHPEAIHIGFDAHQDTNGDILAIDVLSIDKVVPDVTVIVGSPPCVTFSKSNKAGKADKQSGIQLIEKFLQIIAIKKHKPNSVLKYWLMENVPNSRFHVKEKYTFADLGISKKTLEHYDIPCSPNKTALTLNRSERMVFDASDYGVPQRRLRFVTGEFPVPKKTTEIEHTKLTLGSVLDSLRKKTGNISDPLFGNDVPASTITDHYYDTYIPESAWYDAMVKKMHGRYYGKMSFPEDESGPARTIMATRSVKSRESMIFSNGSPNVYRAPTVREAASIMSFPLTYQFMAKSEEAKYRLVGNAVCPVFAMTIAKEIMNELGGVVLPRNHKTPKLPENFIDLRKNPPKIKRESVRHPEASFAAIVPHTRTKGFRVELDNGTPKERKSVLWVASIHHGTGQGKMKVAYPKQKTIRALLANELSSGKLNELDSLISKNFSKKLPDSNSFQEHYVLHKKKGKSLCPWRVLELTSEIVNKSLPISTYDEVGVFYKNKKTGKPRIKFTGAEMTAEKIPVRILASFYVLNYAVQLIKKGGNL